MAYEFECFTPQGWQCPICKRVYAPTTPMCYYCGNSETKTSTSSTSFDIDLYKNYLNHNTDDKK